MSHGTYEEATEKDPCAICEKPDWCSRTKDGGVIFCRRVRRTDGHERRDRSGNVYYVYRVSGAVNPQTATLPEDTDARVPCADAVTRDIAYGALLRALPLSQEHQHGLEERGFTDKDITRLAPGTLPQGPEARAAAVRAVYAALEGRGVDLASIPGFTQREGAEEFELSGSPGMLLPVRNREGQVVAVQIRLDDPPKDAKGKSHGKYRYLSSRRGPGLRGSGPGLHVHVPSDPVKQSESVVRLTEGLLKAELATRRTHVHTLGLPGAGTFESAMPVLKAMRPATVILAYDADCRANSHVADALQRCALAVARAFGAGCVALEVWPEDKGKGIDDVLASKAQDTIERRDGAAAWTTLRDIVNEAGAEIDRAVDALATVRAGIEESLENVPLNKVVWREEFIAAAAILRKDLLPEYEEVVQRVKAARLRVTGWEQSVKRLQPPNARAVDQARETLPRIEVTTDEAAVARAAVEALAAAPNVFQRGGILVRIAGDAAPTGTVSRAATSPRIDPLPVPSLRELLSQTARWVEEQNLAGRVEVHPPAWLPPAIHSRGEWPGVRALTAVVEHPVLRPDGTLLTDPGYDEATGLYLRPAGDSPVVSAFPTETETDAALSLLGEVFHDFPFATAAHRSAAFAALLTPLVRYAFHGPAPLMLIDKNTRGAGGSLLADVIGEIVTGRSMPRMPHSADEQEERKRITAMVLSGTTTVLLDNVVSSLGSATLDAALTGTSWRDRQLGGSQMVELPLLITWFATGNNIRLAGDTSRRSLHIRLETPEENPERRSEFLHDPLRPWVREHRAALLGAALTLLRAFNNAGRPPQGLDPWGSFEDWSSHVRDCLVWLGLEDPGTTRLELQADADETAGSLTDLVEGWAEITMLFGGRCTTAQARGTLEQDITKTSFGRLRSALDELLPSPPGQLPTPRRIGMLLSRYKGRVVGGRALIKAQGRAEGGVVWMVEDRTSTEGVGTAPVEAPVSAVSDSPVTREEHDNDLSTGPSEDAGGETLSREGGAPRESSRPGDGQTFAADAEAEGVGRWEVKL